MHICLWKGCEFASEEFAAFQEHVNTKHVQTQQQQLNLDKQNDGTEEGMVEEEPMAKKAKMNEAEGSKMIKSRGQRKIIFLAVEVWVDVLGFIRRIHLACSVCLINWKLYEICWPRLHGDKVVAHHVKGILIGYRHKLGKPSTALLLKDSKKVPFPECPPPGYITGFGKIQINFLDNQVLAFLSLIAARITTNKVIRFKKMSHLDENQRASVNQLLQLCRKQITTISYILFDGCLSNIQFLQDLDNGMKRIDFNNIEESDIPIIVEFLASPRADGQQRAIRMHFCGIPVARKLLAAIKEEFRTSTQPVPQPFFLQFQTNFNTPLTEEQNLQTDETLTITRSGFLCLEICRHPRGQHEQRAENGRERLHEFLLNNIIGIIVDISEFGMPFTPGL